ncbi:MAG TPA: ABC transporter ATP-binding protein [Candidatus Blautia pullicola]|jgi:ABC-2 type transport system ATP-binding protein|uniref:ABC transporter ATP-binding protein n=1 Tax=Candidatus Blautia pullicola TaxID=2838498 RepID=A0A9D2JTY0_9FIRM|nr:ABC transporter ATP-binding protein [Candidatus Blautia pullicola]
MIKTEKLSKSFDALKAVDKVSLTIQDNSIFGLAGTNGAGKSTLLRMLAGVLLPDRGRILIDEEDVYENPKIKQEIFFLPDTAYFYQNASMEDMARHYAIFYPKYDRQRFEELAEKMGLDRKRKISTFSKGMKRQASLILGICAGTKYLFCDETFDGLDPVMRQAAKSILAYETVQRTFTPIIASHNLRELEDICDHVGLLHKGGVLLSRDVEEMKLQMHKVQCVIPDQKDEEELLKELNVLQQEKRLSLLTMVVRGEEEEIMEKIRRRKPLFAEAIPLTLEEIFISETEVAGYDVKKLFG